MSKAEADLISARWSSMPPLSRSSEPHQQRHSQPTGPPGHLAYHCYLSQELCLKYRQMAAKDFIKLHPFIREELLTSPHLIQRWRKKSASFLWLRFITTFCKIWNLTLLLFALVKSQKESLKAWCVAAVAPCEWQSGKCEFLPKSAALCKSVLPVWMSIFSCLYKER